ncbi:MAG: hypothetical protein M1269_00410 [Chloroflexi bacterium]|nr:hypothetical protein [Chloroflexota bacterium]
MPDFFHPCISMNSGMVKAAYKADFDLEVVAEELMNNGQFEEVRYSPRLGLVKTYGEIQVILFSNGEISARPFYKGDEAYDYIKKLSVKLWDAQICPRSGKALKKCFLPECGEECRAKTGGEIPLVDEVKK